MSRPVVETRHLLLLAAVEEAGSLGAAARELHLTPSALSQQLRELEDRLGGRLFRREWRRLVPTDAGRRLTDAARLVLGELNRAESDARGLIRGTSGAIRVATVCHQSYRWLPDVLASFAQGWPGVEVNVVAEAAPAVCDWLVAHRLDLALVAGDVEPDARVRLTPLFRDELVALVGPAHPWFARRKVAFAAFADQHVWADDGLFRSGSILGRALAQVGVQPRKISLVPMTGIVPIEMARANLGITVMPRWAIESSLAGGELAAVRLGPRGLWLDWSAATRAEPPAPALAAFLATLRVHHPRARQRARTRRGVASIGEA